MHIRFTTLLAAVVPLAAHAFAPAAGLPPDVELAPPPKAAASAVAAKSDDDPIRKLVHRAYVWAWPMTYVRTCREVLRKASRPGRYGGTPVAPVNQLSMLTDYITPTQTAVPCPNQDVVYGCGIFNLALEPVVVQVPDFGDRFWLYQLGDQRTDGFARCGRMYDTKPGCYLVVGPSWNGDVPAGITGVFRSPTPTAYCIPRVFQDDTEADRAAVRPLLGGIMAYPLSQFTGAPRTTDWTKSKWYPNAGASRLRHVDPETFCDDLAQVLAEVPPLAGEEPLYAELKALLARAATDAELKSSVTAAAVEAERELLAPLFEFRNVGVRLPHGWTTVSNGAAFGRDYLTRAAVAKSNIFVNRNEETKYYYQDVDAAGRRLHGANSYRLTFAADRLPSTSGFWSLTVYDAKHAFHPNKLSRYSLGTKSRDLRYNPDGSLTLLIQTEPPAAADQANWLPTPAGDFSLYLRAYAPGPTLVSGAWTPPAVTEVAERSLVTADNR